MVSSESMNPLEILRLLTGFIIINILPGYILSYNVFARGSSVLRLTSSIIISMLVTSIPPMILTIYLGLKWQISLYLTLATTYISSILLIRNKPIKLRLRREHILPPILAGLAIVRYSAPYIILNQYMPFGFDSSFHCRDIRDIVNNVKVTPEIYLHTFHFMAAANVVAMNLPPPTVFILTSILIATLIALEVYVFTEKTLNPYAGFLSYITILLLSVHPFHSLSDGLIPELFAISVLMLGLIKLIDLVRDKSLESMIYSGVLIGSSLYIHATPLSILSSIFLLAPILILHPFIKSTKLHGRNLRIRIGIEVVDGVKLALKILLLIPLALLASLPSSSRYIINTFLSIMGEESLLPVGEVLKPVFPHDFEAVFGVGFLYLGLTSLITLPIINRCREYAIVYSVVISQLVVIELLWIPISFRLLRNIPIFLSVVIGLFLYLILRKLRKPLLSHRFPILLLNILPIILIASIFICLTPKVLESSIQLAESNDRYFPNDVQSYLLLNSLPEGVVLTDFSCGWLPYFTRNKLIIIPPYSFWEQYKLEDRRVFNEIISASSLKPIDAYNTLSKYNISYIYLGVNPQERGRYVPYGYVEVRMNIEELIKLLQDNLLIEKIYSEGHDKSINIVICKVKTGD